MESNAYNLHAWFKLTIKKGTQLWVFEVKLAYMTTAKIAVDVAVSLLHTFSDWGTEHFTVQRSSVNKCTMSHNGKIDVPFRRTFPCVNRDAFWPFVVRQTCHWRKFTLAVASARIISFVPHSLIIHICEATHTNKLPKNVHIVSFALPDRIANSTRSASISIWSMRLQSSNF